MKIPSYYLTPCSKDKVISGTAYFWEESEDSREVYCWEMHLAKSWDSIENMRKDIDFSKKRYSNLNIAHFENSKFIDFVRLDS